MMIAMRIVIVITFPLRFNSIHFLSFTLVEVCSVATISLWFPPPIPRLNGWKSDAAATLLKAQDGSIHPLWGSAWIPTATSIHDPIQLQSDLNIRFGSILSNVDPFLNSISIDFDQFYSILINFILFWSIFHLFLNSFIQMCVFFNEFDPNLILFLSISSGICPFFMQFWSILINSILIGSFENDFCSILIHFDPFRSILIHLKSIFDSFWFIFDPFLVH